MASRRSHAPFHSRNANQRRVPKGTRIHQKPTTSSEGAQLWDKHHLTIFWFREAGPAAHTQSACIRGCVTMARRHSLLCLLQQAHVLSHR